MSEVLAVVDAGRVLLHSHYWCHHGSLLGPFGSPCGALVGFLTILEEILDDGSVSHLCIVYPGRGDSVLFNPKAFFGLSSPCMPGDLLGQVGGSLEICNALGVRALMGGAQSFEEVALQLIISSDDEGMECLLVTDRPPSPPPRVGGVQVYGLTGPGPVVGRAGLSVQWEGELLVSPRRGSSGHLEPIILENYKVPPVIMENVRPVLERLGLNSFIRIPFGAPQRVHARKSLPIRLATSREGVKGVVDAIARSGKYALHAVEAPREGGGLFLFFAGGDGQVSCVTVTDGEAQEPGVPKEAASALLAPLLGRSGCFGYVYDLKTTGALLRSYELPDAGLQFDVQLAAYVLETDKKDYSLSRLAQVWLGLNIERSNGSDEQGAAAGSGKIARVIWDLGERLKSLVEEEDLGLLLEGLDVPIARILGEMESVGFAVDRVLLRNLVQEFSEGKKKAERGAHKAVGREFNLDSHSEVRELLFTKLRLPPGHKTKSGELSTDGDVLFALIDKHPVVSFILQHRETADLLKAASAALHEAGEASSRVHANFNQVAAVTSRISASNPALQAMPVRTAEGLRLREAFLPSPGCLLISADYSQIELRVLAHLSGDEELLKAFKEGEDIHKLTAVALLGATKGAVKEEERRVAKAINYSIIYGAGPAGLARMAEISTKKATDYRRKWFRRHRRVEEFRKGILEKAREYGEVRTLLGRPLPVRKLDRKGQRRALNYVVQGSAADLMKLAMIQLHRRLEEDGWDARILLQVHDELILEAKESQAEKVREITKTVMEGAMDLDTPPKVNVSIDQNWAEVSK